MKIQVTQEHIDRACRRDSRHCMIADAIKEQVKVKWIIVDA